MKIYNQTFIFDINEKVICINKSKPFAVGTVQMLGEKYIVRMDKEYINLSSLMWDYVVPFDIHLKEYLDENDIKEQYELIQEHFQGIMSNKGKRL